MRFLAMANHYVFEPEFCNPAAGWGEPLSAIGSRTMASGQVEKNMQDDNGERAPAFDAAVPILAQLLKAELAEREVRSIHYPARTQDARVYMHQRGPTT